MIMPPRMRKFTLTAHVVASVGWLGAALAFLVLAVIGFTSQDVQIVKAFYLLAQPFTDFVIVPLAFASLLTGIVQSLGTKWGLFRHYWVLFKLLLTVGAMTWLLTSFAHTVDRVAEVAAVSGAELLELRTPSFVQHSGGGLLILLVATVLAVYKPRGMTPYGQRKQQVERREQHEQRPGARRAVDAATPARPRPSEPNRSRRTTHTPEEER